MSDPKDVGELRRAAELKARLTAKAEAAMTKRWQPVCSQ